MEESMNWYQLPILKQLQDIYLAPYHKVSMALVLKGFLLSHLSPGGCLNAAWKRLYCKWLVICKGSAVAENVSEVALFKLHEEDQLILAVQQLFEQGCSSGK